MQLEGKILITGGTGSLGTAILERAEKENWPAEITIVARNETKLNQTKSRFPSIRCEVGDIRDVDWLRTVFKGQELIIHAAAIKIVPVAESNPREAVLTNVIGSMNVAHAAIDAGVKKVVGISSDKVCGPTYYGTTKRLMEGIFRQANDWSNTYDRTGFVLCRYGNVLNSANSIVPLFRKQIAEDKPFTVTDIHMTRFFLSMKQAIDLILFTSEWATAGQIIVPQAPAMKIVDLARAMDSDRTIEQIGIRAGERLHEALIVREEAQHTEYGIFYPFDFDQKYFIIQSPQLPKTSPIWMQTPVSFQYEYTSDDPNHWLTRDEILKLLEDS